MYRTGNTLPQQTRSRSVALLNRHLAGAIDLHARVKQAHWNVRGPAFGAIHELLEEVAEVIEEYSDLIADRAATLGGHAQGTVQTAAKQTFLEPYRLGGGGTEGHIAAVTSALAGFSDSLQIAIDQSYSVCDIETSDLFTEVSRGIDYQLWLVELHSRLQQRNKAPLSGWDSWIRIAAAASSVLGG